MQINRQALRAEPSFGCQIGWPKLRETAVTGGLLAPGFRRLDSRMALDLS